jgi:hypothetical protein
MLTAKWIAMAARCAASPPLEGDPVEGGRSAAHDVLTPADDTRGRRIPVPDCPDHRREVGLVGGRKLTAVNTTGTCHELILVESSQIRICRDDARSDGAGDVLVEARWRMDRRAAAGWSTGMAPSARGVPHVDARTAPAAIWSALNAVVRDTPRRTSSRPERRTATDAMALRQTAAEPVDMRRSSVRLPGQSNRQPRCRHGRQAEGGRASLTAPPLREKRVRSRKLLLSMQSSGPAFRPKRYWS